MKQKTFVHSLAKGKSVDNGRTDISMPVQHNSHAKHCIRLRKALSSFRRPIPMFFPLSPFDLCPSPLCPLPPITKNKS